MCPALSDSCLTGGFVPELVVAVRDWRRALTCRNRVVALRWAQRPSPTARASVADVTKERYGQREQHSGQLSHLARHRGSAAPRLAVRASRYS
ncbi:Uncharacterised protein [Mycobacterium tuberculosis]|uniref:Uncharacterized protein n=1 Tax=Mycobacterium tuberculosis TaxID=1773 RepID=A0A0U0R1F0_MYCTX|nr:Uncharacterised protein [Mycobacterium tuberculosis]COW04067.1 Uncharacterised protein [Mycobacterium tuberculosis]